VQRIFSYV